MTTDTTHRLRWLSAGLAALALAAAPLRAQEPAQEPFPDAQAYDAGSPMAAEDEQAGDPTAYQAAEQTAGQDAEAPAPADGSYGYFRVVEGGASVYQGSGERAAAEVNQPLLAGDRVVVPRGSRVEIVLPDHNLLRLDGGSEVALDRLAGSADSRDGETRIHLLQGDLQLVVDADALGDRLPRIDTENASVYVDAAGSYRVSANASDWTALVVRRGAADVATARGAVIVRAGEEAFAQGGGDAVAAVRAAGAWDPLERWGRALSEQAAAVPQVDQDLQYSASPLAQYGSWIEVAGASYWQPRVDNGWRPFWHGRWVSTPSGLTWVAYEPWGWVPYHYGTWDYLPAYGWVWAPGYVYSPAWVYWYWGPSYTGWCPVGYYTRFYRHRFADPGFRFGVYGWAGGDWGPFTRWSFVDVGHFGHRHLDRFAVAGDRLRDEGRLARMPRGLITTDTRRITPARWSHPRDVIGILASGPGGSQLPDVTPFVARNPHLPPEVIHAVATDGPGKGRLLGTPLRPATLRPQPPPGNRPRAAAGEPAAGPGIRGGRIAVAPERPGIAAPARPDWRDRGGLDRGAAGGRAIALPPAPTLAPGRQPVERGDDRSPRGERPVRAERPRLVVPRGQGDERGERPPLARELRTAPPAEGIRRPDLQRSEPVPPAIAPRDAYRPRPERQRLPSAPPRELGRPALPAAPAMRQPLAVRPAPPAIQRPPVERPARQQDGRPRQGPRQD